MPKEPIRKEETRPTILIVEDDPGVRESYRMIIGDRYDLLEAWSGVEALGIIREKSPNLVLLDIRLPDLDGIEVLEKIRDQDVGLPVILVTAVKTVRYAVSAMKLGAADYITKPFEEADLLRSIERALHGADFEDKVQSQGRLIELLSAKLQQYEQGATITTSRELQELRAISASTAHSVRGQLMLLGTTIREFGRDLSDEQKEKLEAMTKSLRVAESLFDRVLSYLDIGVLPKEKITASALFRDAEGFIKPVLPPNIDFITTIDEDACSDAVLANLGQLRLVLTELSTNAIRSLAGRKGKIWIRASRRDAGLAISVANSGPGIPDAISSKIFDSAVTPGGSGRGVGLFLAASAVRHAGGEIFLESRGSPTIFTIVLPSTKIPEA